MTIRDGYPTTQKPKRFNPTRTRVDEVQVCPPLVSEKADLVGYIRSGGCTPGCGACCEAFVVPLNAEGLEHKDFERVNGVGQIILPVDAVVKSKEGMADWEKWLVLHEVYLFQSPGGLLTAEIPIEASGELPTGFDEWVAWLEQYGITVLRRQNQQLAAYVPIACTKLKDGMCTIVGTDEHPKMCARYPRHPMDIEGLDFCTYKFRPFSANYIAALPLRQTSKKPKRKKKRKKGRRT